MSPSKKALIRALVSCHAGFQAKATASSGAPRNQTAGICGLLCLAVDPMLQRRVIARVSSKPTTGSAAWRRNRSSEMKTNSCYA
jgi:hypothetical protein